MSDDAVKDLEIGLKLILGKRMKEAILCGDTDEARKYATELQKAEDLVAAKPAQTRPHGSPRQGNGRAAVKKKDASGKWIN